MALFAHRFLIDDDAAEPVPGTYDETLGVRTDDGAPVAGGTAALGPTTTKADVDPAARLGPISTRGDVDPDRGLAGALGPVKTSADLDPDRRARR